MANFRVNQAPNTKGRVRPAPKPASPITKTPAIKPFSPATRLSPVKKIGVTGGGKAIYPTKRR